MNAGRITRATHLAAALALCAALAGAAPATARPRAARPAFDTGADVSSLPQVEAGGGTFRAAAGDTTSDALALLRAAGFTSVRLRLWHSPADGACGLDSTLRLAARAHALGFRLLLDLHFSDTWADPGHQSPPAGWRDLGAASLADSVRGFARGACAALVAQGTPPDLVQTGNEIDGGLLWNTGRLEGGGSPAQWDRLAALLAAAARGVREGAPGARIVIHLSRGGDAAGCRAFFERLEAARADWDVCGVSYYPWWHGSLDDLQANLDGLANRFDKDVAVVETAYPWTLRWFDGERNVVGTEAQLRDTGAAAPARQAAFAQQVRRVVAGVPEGHGIGVWWWEPAWIAAPRHGSPWENCALFDSVGVILPAARAFAR